MNDLGAARDAFRNGAQVLRCGHVAPRTIHVLAPGFFRRERVILVGNEIDVDDLIFELNTFSFADREFLRGVGVAR